MNLVILSVGFLGSKLGPESTLVCLSFWDPNLVRQSLPFKMSCFLALTQTHFLPFDGEAASQPLPHSPGGMGEPSGLPSGSAMTLAHRMTLSVVSWYGMESTWLLTEKLAGYLMIWFKIAGRHHILATHVVFSVDHFLKVGRADSCPCHRLLDALHGMCLW